MGQPMRRVSTLAVTMLLLVLITGCGKSTATTVPADNATPKSSVISSPVVSPAASAIPSLVASPSGAVTSSPLMLNGQRALSVVAPDATAPVQYAMSGDTLYRNADGTWNEVGPWDRVYSLLADPTNPRVLYSGGHAGCAVGGPAIPLRKSSDGGETWQTLLTGQNVRPIIVDPRDPQIIYGERCSLAISINGGQTWTDYAMTPSFDVSSISLAGTQLYVLITSEGGTSRIRSVDVKEPANPQIGDDLREFWGGGTVIASTQRIIVGEPHGIDISTDGGQSWSFSRAGLESVTVSVNALTQPIPNDELSRKFGIYVLAVDPENTSHLLAGTIRGLYGSQDSGKTWSRVASIDEVQVNDLQFAQNGAVLYVTTENGVVTLSNP